MSRLDEHSILHKVATFLINVRYAGVILFVLITAGMGYAMSNLQIETGFKKQLPLEHEYMQTFLRYEKEFGGANRASHPAGCKPWAELRAEAEWRWRYSTEVGSRQQEDRLQDPAGRGQCHSDRPRPDPP